MIGGTLVDGQIVAELENVTKIPLNVHPVQEWDIAFRRIVAMLLVPEGIVISSILLLLHAGGGLVIATRTTQIRQRAMVKIAFNDLRIQHNAQVIAIKVMREVHIVFLDATNLWRSLRIVMRIVIKLVPSIQFVPVDVIKLMLQVLYAISIIVSKNV